MKSISYWKNRHSSKSKYNDSLYTLKNYCRVIANDVRKETSTLPFCQIIHNTLFSQIVQQQKQHQLGLRHITSQ